VVDLRKFEFNSKFKMDNVIWAYETTSTITTTSYGSGGVSNFNGSVSNPFSFSLLVFGIYSIDNGVTWSDLILPQTPQFGWGDVWSESSTIYWQWERDFIVSASTAKIRLFGFMPSDVNVSVNAPTPLSKFYLNTEFGYDNLIANGVATIPNYNTSYVVYAHNLGYIPKVMLWVDYGGGTVRRFVQQNNLTNTGTTPTTVNEQYAYLTNTQLLFCNNVTSGDSVKLYYRIYGGQNG